MERPARVSALSPDRVNTPTSCSDGGHVRINAITPIGVKTHPPGGGGVKLVPRWSHHGANADASTPSNHLCWTFLLPVPPQFLYQAPPGAQQLTLPDFSNVPHFEHIIVLAIVEVMAGILTDVAIVVRNISSRSGND